MNKNQLTTLLAQRMNVTEAKAGRALEATLEAVKAALQRGERVSLPGFGSFATTLRSSRRARNPRTGEILEIPASRAVTFKAGSKLTAAVRQDNASPAPATTARAPAPATTAPPRPAREDGRDPVRPWLEDLARDCGPGQLRVLAETTYPGDWISRGWNEGYRVTALTAADDSWAVVMDRDEADSGQWWEMADEFPAQWIEARWQEGYAIAAVASRAGRWAVLVARNAGYGPQALTRGEGFPADWIGRQWAQGYQITALAADNGQWVALASLNAGFQDQRWMTDRRYPAEWVERQRTEGYRLTSLAETAGCWAVVMSR